MDHAATQDDVKRKPHGRWVMKRMSTAFPSGKLEFSYFGNVEFSEIADNEVTHFHHSGFKLQDVGNENEAHV